LTQPRNAFRIKAYWDVDFRVVEEQPKADPAQSPGAHRAALEFEG
jgi:hypothetical protein